MRLRSKQSGDEGAAPETRRANAKLQYSEDGCCGLGVVAPQTKLA